MALESISVTKYIPYDSFIHKLDARFKLIALVFGLTMAFMPIGFTGLTLLLGFIVSLVLLSGMHPRTLLAPLKLIAFIAVVLIIINLLTASVTVNDQDLKAWDWNWTLWYEEGNLNTVYFTVYSEVIMPVLLILLRIYILMLFTTLFTSTTKPTHITNAIESVLKPLKYIKFPIEEIALIISIALRFIPTILDETALIMNSQASRGVDFSNGNLKDKAKSMATLIIPMFANSFQRADDLANAIEARGYVIGKQKTKYKPFKLKLLDYFSILIFLGVFVTMILLSNELLIPQFLDAAVFPHG